MGTVRIAIVFIGTDAKDIEIPNVETQSVSMTAKDAVSVLTGKKLWGFRDVSTAVFATSATKIDVDGLAAFLRTRKFIAVPAGISRTCQQGDIGLETAPTLGPLAVIPEDLGGLMVRVNPQSIKTGGYRVNVPKINERVRKIYEEYSEFRDPRTFLRLALHDLGVPGTAKLSLGDRVFFALMKRGVSSRDVFVYGDARGLSETAISVSEGYGFFNAVYLSRNTENLKTVSSMPREEAVRIITETVSRLGPSFAVIDRNIIRALVNGPDTGP